MNDALCCSEADGRHQAGTEAADPVQGDQALHTVNARLIKAYVGCFQVAC